MNQFTMNRDMMNVLKRDLEIPADVDERINTVLEGITSEPIDFKVAGEKRQKSFRKITKKAVAIVATCVLIVPSVALAAYASGENSPFYQAIFGNSVRSSVSETVQYDEDGKMSLNLPNSERVEVDEETADQLVGQYISNTTGVYQLNRYLGDTTLLTMESVLYDEVTGIFQCYMSFEGGNVKNDMKILENDECYFTGNGLVIGGSFSPGKMYYDSVNSTDSKIYITAVGVALDSDMPKTMEFSEYVDASKVRPEDMPSEIDTKDGAMPLEVAFKLAEVDFSTLGNSLPNVQASDSILLNSVGMQLDLEGLGFADAVDDYALNYISIEYKDGSRYVLRDSESNTENIDYAMAVSATSAPDLTDRTKVTYCFNRMVEVEQISKIVVNEKEYAVV